MTELQWQTGSNPLPMLRFIGPKASARKLQLLGVACCRLIQQHFRDELLDQLVEITERHAEGEAAHGDWQQALREATLLMPDDELVLRTDGPQPAARVAVYALFTTPPARAIETVLSWSATCAARGADSGQARIAEQSNRRQQAELFREIFGNPFTERAVVPEWMSTGGSSIFPGWMIRVSVTARQIAEGIQAEQAYERMPILADAVEEAGCTDLELLAHLRESREHTRGCWALDLILGKS